MEEQQITSKKSKWQIFKEIWSNKKYNALIKLGLYFLFFATIIVYVKLNENIDTKQTSKTKKDTLTTYNEMKNYDYSISYTYDIDTKDISGTFYDDTNYFELNNLEYHYKDDVLLQDEKIIDENMINSLFSINILKFSNHNVYDLIKKSTLNKTVKYSDGTSKLEYYIRYNDFILWYGAEVLTDSSETIKITTYQLNDVINEIQLSGVINNKSFKLNISYTHINEIKSIETGV